MNWDDQLKEVKRAYDNSPDQNQPISSAKYLVLLTAFGSLHPLVDISDSLDTDLRRNLPGGGMRGLETVPSMHQRIADASMFAMTNPIYPPAGACLADNVRVLVARATPNQANMALNPIQNVLQDLIDGKL